VSTISPLRPVLGLAALLFCAPALAQSSPEWGGAERRRPATQPAPATRPGPATQPASPEAVALLGELLDDRNALVNALGLRELKVLTPKQGERIMRMLDSLGYKVRLELQHQRTIIHVAPFKVIRKIYVKGNWPLFEEEILRRLRFRSGQRLPEGRELAQAIAGQEESLRVFLGREGYFEGSLRIQVVPDGGNRVNLKVQVLKGRRHRIGEVVVRNHATRAGVGTSEQALSDQAIAKTYKHKIVFYERTFNTTRLAEDTESLIKRYQSLGYPGVRIKDSYEVLADRPADKAVRLTVDITQRKQIKVLFRGNKQISDKNLREELTFDRESAYDDYEAAQSARAIHRRYQGEGYLLARVRFSRQVGRSADEVTFEIEEGPRFRVKDVSFAGNKAIAGSELGKIIKTRTFPFLGYLSLAEGGYVTETQLRQDIERIETFYREQGFFEAKVTGEVAPDAQLLGRPGALAAHVAARSGVGGGAYVRFSVEEGRQVLVDKVELEGNTLVDTRTLLSQLELKPGRPFTEKALALDKARLVRIYAEKGHPYANVPPVLEELSPDGTRATVQFMLQEGAEARFGPVFIRGNFKTRRSVILSDLPFKPGDRFDIRKIEQADTLMRRREIFNVVRVELMGITEQQTLLPVLVTVEEHYDDHGALEFSVGGATNNPFFGAVAYTNRNLFGFSTSLTLKGEAGLRIQSANLKYSDWRLFGTTLRFEPEGFVRNELTARLGQIFTLGTTVGLKKELFPRLLAAIAYEFRHITHKEDEVHPPGIDEQRQVDVPTRVGGFRPAVVYDRRDNPLNPTRGFRVASSLLLASRYLGGWDDFLKLNVNGQAYIPLPKDMTIALSVRYDHAVPFGEVVLPKVERFYAGGDTTIRGFEEDSAFAERIPLAYAPLGNATLYRLRPQGGNIRLLTNAEFQFPIWKESILFGMPIMGAVFFDNGVVTNSWRGVSGGDFRQGVGGALRIITIVGSASFEYAFAINPKIGDPTFGRFHFNFGFVF
jgi:outer membrane protein insertion porin family